jgi:hypothetical protein
MLSLAYMFFDFNGDRLLHEDFCTRQELLVILARQISIDSRRSNITGSIPAETTPKLILPSRCRSGLVWLDRTVKP